MARRWRIGSFLASAALFAVAGGWALAFGLVGNLPGFVRAGRVLLGIAAGLLLLSLYLRWQGWER